MATKRQAQLRAAAQGIEFVDTTLPASEGKSSNHYVDNDELRDEMIKCKKTGEPSRKLVDMFMKIARQFSNKFTYMNPDDREDCIAFALLDCIRYWDRYDPSVSPRAFSYVTTMCSNGFGKGWHKLGKMKCPDSLKIPLSDNIYSI